MNSPLLNKVQLIKGCPPCQPGKCAICGTPGDENSEFLDFGLELDYYGVVYFCSTCVMSDVLTAMDLVTRERFEQIKLEADGERFKAEAILADNQELRGIIDALSRHGYSVSDSGSSSDSEQSVVDEKPKSTESVNRKSTAAKSRSVKQTNEPGSSNVRVNDSTEEFDL